MTANISHEYPKTANLFARDPDTHKVIKEPKAEFGQIADWLVTEKIDGTNIRLVFDALDRESRHPVLRGRSDAANLPPDFFEEAFPQFETEEDMRLCLGLALKLIQQENPDAEEKAYFSMIVFGEGYGPGIQKGGGLYAPSKRFRSFDVATFKTVYRPQMFGWGSGTGNLFPFTTGPLWRTFREVQTVSQALGVETAPVVSWFQRMDTTEVIRYVREDHDSLVAVAEGTETVGDPTDGGRWRNQEGVIARTDPYLYDSRGSRVMFKLKGKDLA